MKLSWKHNLQVLFFLSPLHLPAPKMQLRSIYSFFTLYLDTTYFKHHLPLLRCKKNELAQASTGN